jgi:predicted nucleic acid-binding protein
MSVELVFVDTNVLLYEWDTREPEKQARAIEWMRRLWESRRGRISYQVLTEFYVTATRKLKPGMAPAAAQRNVRTLFAWSPVRTDHRSLERAWELQEAHDLSWWDALIVAAAERVGCRYLLSEDLQHGAMVGGVTVIDPFRTEPE